MFRPFAKNLKVFLHKLKDMRPSPELQLAIKGSNLATTNTKFVSQTIVFCVLPYTFFSHVSAEKNS